jgi:hypothetical protein
LLQFSELTRPFEDFTMVLHGFSPASAVITPQEEARRSNLRHRPVGLGVQGLADAFLMMKMPFESPEAKQLNEETDAAGEALMFWKRVRVRVVT